LASPDRYSFFDILEFDAATPSHILNLRMRSNEWFSVLLFVNAISTKKRTKVGWMTLVNLCKYIKLCLPTGKLKGKKIVFPKLA
jgi:hypothetical protein